MKYGLSGKANIAVSNGVNIFNFGHDSLLASLNTNTGGLVGKWWKDALKFFT